MFGRIKERQAILAVWLPYLHDGSDCEEIHG
jgi:hypothetical protein